MTDKQWDILVNTIGGKLFDPMPVGFIIDSPWIPGWFGISTVDYYSNDNLWLQANLKAIETFPDILFLPGFWSEFGMCTEPSAFGAKQIWSENSLPHADKVLLNPEDIDKLAKPNVKTDGLLPFMIKRLIHNEKFIIQAGHSIKFAVSRGPLNIASFLMGTTEFLLLTQMDPDRAHILLRIITDFTKDWIDHQLNSFDSIDGLLLLDDITGFIGDEDFKNFALPYLKEIYQCNNLKVNFFHNDAEGLISARYLNKIGVNLFNFSYKHSVTEIKELTDGKITLLGNIPPRDVMAQGSVKEVRMSVIDNLLSINDKIRLIASCGGGMPQDVSTANIQAFIKAVNKV